MSDIGTVISEDEFVRAHKLHGKPTRKTRILYAVIAFAAIAAGILVSERLLTIAMASLLGSVVGHLLIDQVLRPFLARREYRKYPTMRQPFEVALLPEGVRFKSTDGEGRVT